MVGASNTDLLTKVPRLPKMGETLIGSHFHMGFGGKGANQAVMAAKLGADVAMVTKLGKDRFGEATFKNFLDRGIDTKNVIWSDEASGVAPILVDNEGNNLIVIVPGASWMLSSDDVRSASKAIRSADVTVCQLEVPLDTTLEAMRIAKRENRLTILNPAPWHPLPEEAFLLSDIIVPNQVEAEALSEMPIKNTKDAEKATMKMVDMGTKSVIITMGGGGAILGDARGVEKIATIPVTCADSTGAGDAFLGTLAYSLATDANLRDSVRMANVAAALSVTKLGSQLSFPSKEEIRMQSLKWQMPR